MWKSRLFALDRRSAVDRAGCGLCRRRPEAFGLGIVGAIGGMPARTSGPSPCASGHPRGARVATRRRVSRPVATVAAMHLDLKGDRREAQSLQ